MFHTDQFVYWGALILDDGSEHIIDFDQKGWAEPTRLARTVRFSLVPKGKVLTLKGRDYPTIVVNIPIGGKPVFKTRVKSSTPMGPSEGRHPASIRIYGIGYKKGNQEHLSWVLPTGDIEVGEDSVYSDLLVRQLTYT